MPSTQPIGLLARMRIRKKLIFLHTCFSLGLAAVLVIASRPAVNEIVNQSERSEAMLWMKMLEAALDEGLAGEDAIDEVRDVFDRIEVTHVRIATSSLEDAPFLQRDLHELQTDPGTATPIRDRDGRACAAIFSDGRVYTVHTTLRGARKGVRQLYVFMSMALLAAYALVALSLELLVLPQHVYGPIRSMLDADRAIQEGRSQDEMIPEAVIPADELGEIMRSRNRAIETIRNHERALEEAFAQVERIANDLQRKNHMLETARRNLQDADRLASLGMMSAGIAHELNTPLAVLKGLVETLNTHPERIEPEQAALMGRVVGRLERLGESLLDFARVRPPETKPTHVREIVDEAITLVSLDTQRPSVRMVNAVDADLVVPCDPDRILQVMINLLRNAVDALREHPGDGRVEVASDRLVRDEESWVSVTVTDNGPGIEPEDISRLFEPFVTTRLDARGTGLGLAVAHGIMKEHDGTLLVRNLPGRAGAVFEMLLPAEAEEIPDDASS